MLKLIFTLSIVTTIVFVPTAHAQTAYNWIGGNGNWDVPANWSPMGVPAAPDTVTVGSGIPTLIANTEIAKLRVTGFATIAGDADLTVTDSLVWSGGGGSHNTFEGSGMVIIPSGAVLRMIGPTSSYRGSPTRTIVNDGTMIWEGSGQWNGEGKIVNNNELILSFTGTDNLFLFSSLTNAITNSSTGVIRKTGSGATRYSGGLVNNGSIEIENGTLTFQGFNATGVTGTGGVVVNAGTKLRITGGNNSLSGDPSVLGSGTVEIAGGTFTFSGSYDVDETLFTGFGVLDLDGTGSTSTLTMNAGELNGSGDFTVTSSLNWTGGRIGGSGTTVLGPSVPLVIGGSSIGLSDTRTLRVEGMTTWSGDTDFTNTHGTTVFENAGTLNSTGPGARMFFAGTFRNTGTLIHNGGTLNTTSFFHNEGLVQVIDGELRHAGFNANGGTDTGRYEVTGTGLLSFTGGSRALTSSATVAGDGSVALSGGAINNKATWRPGPLANPGIGVMNITTASSIKAGFGTLEVHLSGLTPGTEFDQFNVTGDVELRDTVRVTLEPGFEPVEGDRFLIIPATGSVTGSVDDLQLPQGMQAFLSTSASGVELVVGSPVSIEEGEVPITFALHEVYPNPFNPSATVSYDVASSENVRIALFDVLGREVAVLVDAQHQRGRHSKRVDGAALPSGLYFVRMTAGTDFTQTRRIVLLK